jgi:hypothetical protein
VSPSRWAQSAFIALHVTALAISLPPGRDSTVVVGGVRQGAGVMWPPTLLTPVLDRIAIKEEAFTQAVDRLTRPVRPVTERYLTMLGIGIGWWMFSNPSRDDMYVRARYYIEPADKSQGALTVVDEVVFPALPPRDRLRVATSFKTAYLDKTADKALVEFHRRLEGDQGSVGASEALAPIARYYQRRFTRESLAPADRVTRVELWHGTARNPPPERGSDPEIDRVNLLYPPDERHRQRPARVQGDRLFRTEESGGVRWVLDYADAP